MKKEETGAIFNFQLRSQVTIWIFASSNMSLEKSNSKKLFIHTLYIWIHRVEFGRLEGYESWAKFLALDYLFVGFRLGQFLVYICDLDRCYWVWFFLFFLS